MRRGAILVTAFCVLCAGLSLAVLRWTRGAGTGLEPLEARADALVRLWLERGTPGFDREVLLVLADPYSGEDALAPSSTLGKRGLLARWFSERRDDVFLTAFGAESHVLAWGMPGPEHTGAQAAALSRILVKLAEADARIRVVAHGSAGVLVLDAALRAAEGGAAGPAPVVERIVAPGLSVAAAEARLAKLPERIVSVPASGEAVFVWSDAARVPPTVRMEVLGYGRARSGERSRPAEGPWKACVDPLLARGAAALPPPPGRAPVSEPRGLPELPPLRPAARVETAGSRPSSLPRPAPASEPVTERAPAPAQARSGRPRLEGRCVETPHTVPGICWQLGPHPGLDLSDRRLRGDVWSAPPFGIGLYHHDTEGREEHRRSCPPSFPGIIRGEHRGLELRICRAVCRSAGPCAGPDTNGLYDGARGDPGTVIVMDRAVMAGGDGFLLFSYYYPEGRGAEHLPDFMAILESLRPPDR